VQAGSVESECHCTAAEAERKFKLQDVLLKAMAKRITWWEAAELIGVTDRTMRRWRDRLGEHGYYGRRDRCKGRPKSTRVPLQYPRSITVGLNVQAFDLAG
jgi:hypothetical protein